MINGSLLENILFYFFRLAKKIDQTVLGLD